MKTTHDKLESLKDILRGMESVVIGYSGGVDSTFLAKVATDVLGENALSVSAISESYASHEREEAVEIADELGLNYVAVNTSEVSNPEYRKNAPNRCYFCKEELITHLNRIKGERNFNAIAIGTITDDLGDYRPGQSAAQKGGARFPLVEAELGKEEVRQLSKEMNIRTWDKPALACLSSRFPYGEEVTPEKLAMVEKAEAIVREYGFHQFRVRHHKDLARIEIMPEEIQVLLDNRNEIYRRLKETGYTYVAMDLMGYRSGSMNEALFQIGLSTSLTR